MIYAEHDFTMNFCNAIGYSNDFMMRDILIDEVGRLIIENKADVVKLLRNNGINATVNDSPETIALYITNEIAKKNEAIVNGIAAMISRNQFNEQKFKTFTGAVLAQKGKHMNADATTGDKTAALIAGAKTGGLTGAAATPTEKSFWKKLGEAFKDPAIQQSASTLIAAGLTKAYDKSTPKTTSENQANLNERLKINQVKQKPKLDYKKIIIITGGLVIIGTLAFLLIKAKKQQQSTI